jgi:hypothetical protein
MKKTFALALLLVATVAGVLAPVSASAAEFEGRIKMKMQPKKGDPQTITFAKKGQRMRMEIPTGKETMVGLMDFEKREMSMLMPGQNMYMVIEQKDIPLMDEVRKSQESTTLEKTSETAKILGYDTTKYIARDGKNVTELWLAEGLGTWFNMAGGSPMKARKLADWEREVIAKGFFPLRMVSLDSKGKPSNTTEVVELTPQKLDDSLFVPPAGYTRFSLGGMLKGLGGAGEPAPQR